MPRTTITDLGPAPCLREDLAEIALRMQKVVGDMRSAVDMANNMRINVEKQLVAKALELQTKIDALDTNILDYVQHIAKDVVERETKNVGTSNGPSAMASTSGRSAARLRAGG